MQVEGLLGSTWVIGWYIWAILWGWCTYYAYIMTFFSALFMGDWYTTYTSSMSQCYDWIMPYY
jgi:hypothetical protein